MTNLLKQFGLIIGSILLVIAGVFGIFFNFQENQIPRYSFDGSNSSSHIMFTELTGNQLASNQLYDFNLRLKINNEDGKIIELFSLDNDAQRASLILSPNGKLYFRTPFRNFGKYEFQKNLITPGNHEVVVGISPVSGLQVTVDGNAVISASALIENYGLGYLNSITINPQKNENVYDFSGSISISDEVKTKSISSKLFLSGILILIGAAGIVRYTTRKMKIRLPENAQKSIRTMAVVSGFFTLFLLTLDQLGIASLSYGPTAFKRSDWYDSVGHATGDSFLYSSAAYPPFSYFILSLVNKDLLPEILVICIAASIGVLLSSVAILLKTSSKKTGYFSGLVLAITYPTLFAIDRGNVDLFVTALSMIGIMFFLAKKHYWAILFASVVSASKLFPASTFILAFKSVKKWFRYILMMLLATVILTVSSFIYLGTSAETWLSNLVSSSNLMKIPLSGFTSNTISIGSALISGAELFRNKEGYFEYSHLANRIYDWVTTGNYSIIVLSIYIISCVWAFFSKQELWLRTTLITVIGMVFSPLTYAYRILAIFPAIALLSTAKKPLNVPYFLGISIGIFLAPTGQFTEFLSPEIPIRPIVNTIAAFLVIIAIVIEMHPRLAFWKKMSTEKIIRFTPKYFKLEEAS